MALIAARDILVTLIRKLFFDMLPLRLCVGLETPLSDQLPSRIQHPSYITYHVSCWILQDHATFFDL